MNLGELIVKLFVTIIVIGMGFGVAVSLSMMFTGLFSWTILIAIMTATILVTFEKWGFNVLSL